MIFLSWHWLLDLGGRFHPLVLHFPIGLLVGALALESWNKWRGQSGQYSSMIYLGAASAVIAAIFGGLLKASGEYEGTLVDQHEFTGYLTAVLSTACAFTYYYRDRLPKHLPFVSLLVCGSSITVAGHLGASLTHGADYLSAVLPQNQAEGIDTDLLAAFSNYNEGDTFPQDQLDRLNLQVRALFAHKCYQCHSTAKRKGGLALDHEEGVFAGGDSGPIIQAGAANESELIRRLLLPRSDEESMPPKGKILQTEEIELIKIWIDQGAHWADESLKIFREAPLALTRPTLPAAPAELDHPIDKFVNVYFEEQGLAWPTLIDDRQFIRRAYLDISGLLPSPAAIEQFTKAEGKNKREELIKSLLADKENYVLHWLSFWNDLLRNDYSGTGFITGGRKQITDWLYRSLLEEKPYDQMAKELINPSPESEGFIKGIQWRGEVNASQRTEIQAAQNISQSLLGLNLKCASCHNSFINNLTLDQAYAFANIFAEEPLEVYRCDKPTGRMAQTGFLYPSLGEVVSDSIKGRLAELAQVIVQPENGRLYRTIVNRFWDRLFGRGIVAPVDEMDNLPWSQDLLDWITADFIQNDYSLSQLLVSIMTSRAYQLPALAYPSPEYLASEEFVFKGPSVRRLSAEQFVDAFGQVVRPLYHGLAFDPDSTQMDANWIWHEEIELDRRVLPKPGARLFRKTFSTNSGPALQAAEVVMTVDHSFEFYLNGQAITSADDWREVQRFEVPVDLLTKENIIAIRGKNEGIIANPAGLLFSMRLQYADSSFQYIHSNRSWKTSADTLAKQWQSIAFDDSEWSKAWRAGTFEKSYWGVLPGFNFDAVPSSSPLIRAALVRQDNFMKTLGRPVRENVTTQREKEATLLQSLLLTNSTFFHENIKQGAQAWLAQSGDDLMTLMNQLYLNALGRKPTRKEQKILRQQLNTENKAEALEDIIWAMVLLPEFQLI